MLNCCDTRTTIRIKIPTRFHKTPQVLTHSICTPAKLQVSPVYDPLDSAEVRISQGLERRTCDIYLGLGCNTKYLDSRKIKETTNGVYDAGERVDVRALVLNAGQKLLGSFI